VLAPKHMAFREGLRTGALIRMGQPLLRR